MAFTHDAIEAALKLARQYWLEVGRPRKHKIIALAPAYQGNTPLALSASAREHYRTLYHDWLVGVVRIPAPYAYRTPAPSFVRRQHYWRIAELGQIGEEGFGALHAKMDSQCIDRFAREAAGSPQLMQLICLNACFVLDLREKRPIPRSVIPTNDQIKSILEQTSASTDFRSLVDVLDAGPKTRGTERKTYRFADGSDGDVYRCVLKAVASDPPKLSFQYDELLERTAKVCSGESPVGSSVVGTCVHMSKLALERFAHERAIDWDDQKTDS
jgi:hypothetical protein